MNETGKDGIQKGSALPGLACLGCVSVGSVALVLALMAAIRFQQYTAAGVCLAASALAFGLLANAAFRS
jgi:hypothetical protein